MSDSVDPVWGLKLSPAELAAARAEAASAGVPGPSGPATRGVATYSTSMPPISADEHLDEADLACFAEIQQVLRRHGKVERFGVALLHSHFPLDRDEVMVESTDVGSRQMTQVPGIVDPSEVGLIDTQWYLGATMPLSPVKCRTSMHI